VVTQTQYHTSGEREMALPFRAVHPAFEPGETFEQHQQAMAEWCGYRDADGLNADHDALHMSLARWLGVDSNAMRQASGAILTPGEAELAALEEDAVLSTQRYMKHAGASVPTIAPQ
jgi:hypothetical protein